MIARALVSAFLLTTPGCASLSRASAAEAMNCPENDLREGDVENPEGARLIGALLVLPLAVALKTSPIAVGGRTQRNWTGCGVTYMCNDDGCNETQLSRAARLRAAVPDLMERTRQRVPGATVERSGYFTWDLSSPRGPAQCHLTSIETYRCSPDLDATPPLPPPATPTPPPAPPPVDLPRVPLKSRAP